MGLSRQTMRRIHGMMFKLPMMITGEAFEDFILAYREDDLPPGKKFVFEMHLKLCAECRDYLKAYRSALELAKSGSEAAAAVVPEDVPEDLIRAVIDANSADD